MEALRGIILALPPSHRKMALVAVTTRKLAVDQWQIIRESIACPLITVAGVIVGEDPATMYLPGYPIPSLALLFGTSEFTIKSAIYEWQSASDAERERFIEEMRAELSLLNRPWYVCAVVAVVDWAQKSTLAWFAPKRRAA